MRNEVKSASGGKKIKKIKLPQFKFKKINLKEKPLWVKIVAVAVILYLLAGIGFAIVLYKKCSTEEGQKCSRDNKAVKFSTSIYPFPVAWIRAQPIWAKNFFKQIDYIKHFSEKSGQELPDRVTLETQVLDQMIDVILVKKEAAKHGITITKADIEEAYKKVIEENGGQEEVEKVLKDLYGMTKKDFKALIRDQLYQEKVKTELFVQVHARHILIKDEGRAKEILEEAKKGEKSFEDLAKEFSEDTGSRDNGGDLGWFYHGTMVPEFEEAAFTLEAGQITEEPVKTEFGYHIIKVDEKKGELNQSFTDWLTETREKSKIKKWL